MRTLRRRPPALLAALAGVALLGVGAALLLPRLGSEGRAHGGSVPLPIDPRQQTAVGFGERSHWLQPWRGYLDTPPATRLLDAIGINFNVEPSEAEATARMLSRSGFRRARVEFSWDMLAYRDPARLAAHSLFPVI